MVTCPPPVWQDFVRSLSNVLYVGVLGRSPGVTPFRLSADITPIPDKEVGGTRIMIMMMMMQPQLA
jgi:hypothetical protein